MPLEFCFKLCHDIVQSKLWNMKHAIHGRAFRFSELFFICLFWKLSQRSERNKRIKEEIPFPNQIPACTRQSVRWEKSVSSFSSSSFFFFFLLLFLFIFLLLLFFYDKFKVNTMRYGFILCFTMSKYFLPLWYQRRNHEIFFQRKLESVSKWVLWNKKTEKK